ncbi:hypothetical protein DERF_004555, partial [Dermatophagoides farinae]
MHPPKKKQDNTKMDNNYDAFDKPKKKKITMDGLTNNRITNEQTNQPNENPIDANLLFKLMNVKVKIIFTIITNTVIIIIIIIIINANLGTKQKNDDNATMIQIARWTQSGRQMLENNDEYVNVS